MAGRAGDSRSREGQSRCLAAISSPTAFQGTATCTGDCVALGSAPCCRHPQAAASAPRFIPVPCRSFALQLAVREPALGKGLKKTQHHKQQKKTSLLQTVLFTAHSLATCYYAQSDGQMRTRIILINRCQAFVVVLQSWERTKRRSAGGLYGNKCL